MTPLTDAEYVAKEGCICPFCGDDQIEGGHIEVDCLVAWQPIHCHACDKTWNDLYKLEGYDETCPEVVEIEVRELR